MSEEYKFPCDCGHHINVTISDAGKTIGCEVCGVQLQLPRLRDIKNLEPVEKAADKKSAEKTWSYEKGVWYASGMGAIIIGLVIAVSCFYIGHYKFDDDRPEVRAEWILTSEKMPETKTPVFAFAPEPAPGRTAYEYTIWDPEKEVWVFQDPKKKPQPKEYFAKWGSSFQASIEASVYVADMKDLWKFWYETEPKEPLKEWQDPVHVLNRRFAVTFYSFAGLGGAIALLGMIMVVYSVMKR